MAAESSEYFSVKDRRMLQTTMTSIKKGASPGAVLVACTSFLFDKINDIPNGGFANSCLSHIWSGTDNEEINY